MISALNRLSDGTIELTINIPWKRVSQVYQQKLEQLSKVIDVKGFRKGKAPKKMVEKQVNKTTLYQEILKEIIPDLYLEAIKEHQLKPIVNPQINVLSLQEKKDWQIKAVTCEIPEIKLGSYKEEIRKALASDKIWTPGKDKEKQNPESESKKLDKIFRTLLGIIKLEVPKILVQEEANKMLSKLIDQTNQLGLTLEQYLASSGKTADGIKEEYQKQAEQTIKLELILSKIADEEQIKVTDDQVEKMIKSIPEKETQKSFENKAQKAYIRQILRKRQVIDNLAKL